jgi:hypothetical protein
MGGGQSENKNTLECIDAEPYKKGLLARESRYWWGRHCGPDQVDNLDNAQRVCKVWSGSKTTVHTDQVFHPILFWPRSHVVINKLKPAEAEVACTASVNVEEKSDDGDNGERRLSG